MSRRTTTDGPACPAVSPDTIRRATKLGKCRLNEYGDLERLCGTCGEWWHADTEFYSFSGTPFGLHSRCKACEQERKQQERARAMTEEVAA